MQCILEGETMALIYPKFKPALRQLPMSAPADLPVFLTRQFEHYLESSDTLLLGIGAWLTMTQGTRGFGGWYILVHEEVMAFLDAIRDQEPQMDIEYVDTYWRTETSVKTVVFMSVAECIHLTFEMQCVMDTTGEMSEIKVMWGDKTRVFTPRHVAAAEQLLKKK